MRRFAAIIAMFGAAALVCGVALHSAPPQKTASPPKAEPYRLTAEDRALLTEIEKRSVQFFWDAGDPDTGITREHLYWNGTPYQVEKRDVGSTGATGFGVTALCIGAEHGWIPREKARERALNTLRCYADRAPQEHVW